MLPVPTSFTLVMPVIEIVGAGVGHAVAVGQGGDGAEGHVRDARGQIDRGCGPAASSVTLGNLPGAVAGVGHYPAGTGVGDARDKRPALS